MKKTSSKGRIIPPGECAGVDRARALFAALRIPVHFVDAGVAHLEPAAPAKKPRKKSSK